MEQKDESELQQLDVYHEELARITPDLQVSRLRSGYVPVSPELLVEAGIRCVPLMESQNNEISEAARDRLEVILLKLSLGTTTSAIRRAMDELELRMQKHKQQSRTDMKYGFALFIGLTIVIAGLAVLIVYFILR